MMNRSFVHGRRVYRATATLVLVALVVLGGCRFQERDLPSSALADTHAIVDARLDALRVRSGAEVTVTFKLDENIDFILDAQSPAVQLGLQDASTARRTVSTESLEPDGTGLYTVRFVAQREDTESNLQNFDVAIVARYQDGSWAEIILPLIVDDQPPQLSGLTIPTVIGLHTEAPIVFETVEPLSFATRVRVGPSYAKLSALNTQADDAETYLHRFVFQPEGSETQGSTTVTIIGVDDVGLKSELSEMTELDFVAPTIVGMTVPSGAQSAGSYTVDVQVADPNDVASASLWVEEQRLSTFQQSGSTLSFDVDLSNGFDGNHSVRAVVQDAAGNEGASVETILIDSGPPTLTIARLEPQVARSGQSVYIELRSDEELATASVSVGANAATAQESSFDPLSLSYRYLFSATVSGSDGTLNVSGTGTDLNGNGATTDMSILTLDSTPPMITVDNTNPSIFSDWPVGTLVTVTFDVSEHVNVGIGRAFAEVLIGSRHADIVLENGGMRVVASRTMDGTEYTSRSPNRDELFIRVSDEAGNIAEFSTSALIDGKPFIQYVYPPEGSTGLRPNTEIALRFSEDVQNVDTASIVVEGESYTIEHDGADVRIVPNGGWTEHETITVRMTTALQDTDATADAPLAEKTFSFKTTGSTRSFYGVLHAPDDWLRPMVQAQDDSDQATLASVAVDGKGYYSLSVPSGSVYLRLLAFDDRNDNAVRDAEEPYFYGVNCDEPNFPQRFEAAAQRAINVDMEQWSVRGSVEFPASWDSALVRVTDTLSSAQVSPDAEGAFSIALSPNTGGRESLLVYEDANNNDVFDEDTEFGMRFGGALDGCAVASEALHVSDLTLRSVSGMINALPADWTRPAVAALQSDGASVWTSASVPVLENDSYVLWVGSGAAKIFAFDDVNQDGIVQDSEDRIAAQSFGIGIGSRSVTDIEISARTLSLTIDNDLVPSTFDSSRLMISSRWSQQNGLGLLLNQQSSAALVFEDGSADVVVNSGVSDAVIPFIFEDLNGNARLDLAERELGLAAAMDTSDGNIEASISEPFDFSVDGTLPSGWELLTLQPTVASTSSSADGLVSRLGYGVQTRLFIIPTNSDPVQELIQIIPAQNANDLDPDNRPSVCSVRRSDASTTPSFEGLNTRYVLVRSQAPIAIATFRSVGSGEWEVPAADGVQYTLAAFGDRNDDEVWDDASEPLLILETDVQCEDTLSAFPAIDFLTDRVEIPPGWNNPRAGNFGSSTTVVALDDTDRFMIPKLAGAQIQAFIFDDQNNNYQADAHEPVLLSPVVTDTGDSELDWGWLEAEVALPSSYSRPRIMVEDYQASILSQSHGEAHILAPAVTDTLAGIDVFDDLNHDGIWNAGRFDEPLLRVDRSLAVDAVGIDTVYHAGRFIPARVVGKLSRPPEWIFGTLSVHNHRVMPSVVAEVYGLEVRAGGSPAVMFFEDLDLNGAPSRFEQRIFAGHGLTGVQGAGSAVRDIAYRRAQGRLNQHAGWTSPKIGPAASSVNLPYFLTSATGAFSFPVSLYHVQGYILVDDSNNNGRPDEHEYSVWIGEDAVSGRNDVYIEVNSAALVSGSVSLEGASHIDTMWAPTVLAQRLDTRVLAVELSESRTFSADLSFGDYDFFVFDDRNHNFIYEIEEATSSRCSVTISSASTNIILNDNGCTN